MRSETGLTLIEVLIAIVILAVGVLAAATMQTTALRASNDARAIQGVTKTAEAEIEFRRQIDLTATAGQEPTCKTTVATGYTCVVSVVPCSLSAAALSCSSGVSSPVADQATVTVNGPRSKTITLKTVRAR